MDSSPYAFYPHHEKPITHVVVVTQPVRFRKWAVSEELANKKAEEYRQRGWTAHVEPINKR